MVGRYACALGTICLLLACSDDKSPGDGATGGAAGGGSLSGASSGGAGGSASHPGGGAGAANVAGGGSASGGSASGGATVGGGGVAAQAGTQSAGTGGDGMAGGGPLPDEFEIATKQKAPTGIAIDAEFVYWGNRDAGTIVKCPLDGCGGKAPTVVASNIGTPMGVTVSTDTVFWMAPPTDASSKIAQVLKCPLSGCTGVPERLFQFTVENRAVGVKVKGDLLYYASWPQLGSCALSGCNDTPTAFTRMPALGVDANDELLFVARSASLISCSLDGCKDPQTLAMGQFLSLAIDATHAYVTAYDYAGLDSGVKPGIFRCPLAGCGSDAPEVIKDAKIAPFGVAVNETRIFYTDTVAGTVVSLAKPD